MIALSFVLCNSFKVQKLGQFSGWGILHGLPDLPKDQI